MEINKVSQSTNVQHYDVKPAKENPAPKTEAPKDQVVISKEALEAAEKEKSHEAASSSNAILKMSEEERAELVSALKAKMEQDMAKFFNFVRESIATQGQKFAEADDIWKFIASGKYEVDEATKKEAQEAISEDGYYGVKQTTDRIFDFALALTGGDKEKMKKMEAAFEEGYKEATKAWGQELPGISKQTYDAVKEKFAAFYRDEE